MDTELSKTVLRAANIDLLPFTMDDVDETYQGWLYDEEVVQYLAVANSDRSMPALREYIQSVIDNPDRYFYSIVSREENLRIGTISFEIDKANQMATWGFLIGDKNFWGGSFALEAHVAMFDFAFENFDIRRFWGGAIEANIAARFNYKRLGFTLEGTEVQDSIHYDVPVSISFYSLYKETWRENSGKFDRLRFPGNI